MTDNGYHKLFDELWNRINELYPNPLQLLTRKQVSELTQLPLGTIDYLTATKQLIGIRLGKRSIRYHPLMMVDWYAARLGVEYKKPQKKPKPRKRKNTE